MFHSTCVCGLGSGSVASSYLPCGSWKPASLTAAQAGCYMLRNNFRIAWAQFSQFRNYINCRLKTSHSVRKGSISFVNEQLASIPQNTHAVHALNNNVGQEAVIRTWKL